MFTFLLIVQTLVAAALVTVILMQRSEGGGLGVGGSTSGLMSARGAADFLTRATAILATLFVTLSIALAGVATIQRAPGTIDPSLARTPAAPAPGQVPLGQAPGAVPLATDDPLAGAAAAVPGTAVTGAAVPPTGNLDAPTPPENRLRTPERNRPATPAPAAGRQTATPAPARERQAAPPVVEPAADPQTNSAVPPAAPKQ